MSVVSSVAALPMSIWPQAMSKPATVERRRFVSPVIACFAAVYGAKCGRGTWADSEPLLTIRPPRRSLLLHQPHRLARAQEGAGHVRLEHRCPELEVDLLERRGSTADASVVEQQVEATERLHGTGEQVPHRVLFLTSAETASRRAPIFSPSATRLVQRLRSTTGDHDVVSVCRERQRDCPAHPGAATGDDGDLFPASHAEALYWLRRPARGMPAAPGFHRGHRVAEALRSNQRRPL